MRFGAWSVVATLTLSAAVLASCGDDGPPDPKPTLRSTATPLGTPTAAAVGSEALARAFLEQGATKIRGERGAEAVIAVVDAIESGSPKVLEALLAFQTAPCIVAAGDHGEPFPVCEEGEPAGTEVTFIPALDAIHPLGFGFRADASSEALDAVLERNTAEMVIAGQTEDQSWFLGFELAEPRAAPHGLPHAVRLWVKLDFGYSEPVVAIAWGDSGAVEHYRLWDRYLERVVFIAPEAAASQ